MLVSFVMGIQMVFGIFNFVPVLSMQSDRIPRAYYLIERNTIFARILEFGELRLVPTTTSVHHHEAYLPRTQQAINKVYSSEHERPSLW
jgi:hypothetical protein